VRLGWVVVQWGGVGCAGGGVEQRARAEGGGVRAAASEEGMGVGGASEV
jgi:hypothetical protein